MKTKEAYTNNYYTQTINQCVFILEWNQMMIDYIRCKDGRLTRVVLPEITQTWAHTHKNVS